MNNKHGFTLIELLLVVMVIGFMLAVIIPRGLRATTDAKYALVRQNCAELASFGNDWIEQQMLAQNANSTATRANYLDSLVDYNGAVPDGSAAWVADSSHSNWNNNGSADIPIIGRYVGTPFSNRIPENTVQEIIDPAKILRNPFNGGNIFLSSPNEPQVGSKPIPGAIACVVAQDSSTGGLFDYYALIFQGTDSTVSHIDPQLADFHAGMAAGGSLPGAREGVFFTKVRQ